MTIYYYYVHTLRNAEHKTQLNEIMTYEFVWPDHASYSLVSQWSVSGRRLKNL
jgi:hypothetical protein